MYSIRPHSAASIPLELPTTMYSIKPIIGQSNESSLAEVEQRQDHLLEKIEQLMLQVTLLEKSQSAARLSVPRREELVVHLDAQQPSKAILALIEQFRDQLSVRTYRHSSVRTTNPLQHLSSSNDGKNKRTLTVVWAEGEHLPYMLHSQMTLNDEQAIVNVLSQQLTSQQ